MGAISTLHFLRASRVWDDVGAKQSTGVSALPQPDTARHPTCIQKLLFFLCNTARSSFVFFASIAVLPFPHPPNRKKLVAENWP